MSEDVNYTLIKKVKITGEILLVTGIHIGGTNTAMEIGGLDCSVVRNPLTGKPYIPGSSLKGKLRSLLELHEGSIMYKKMGKVQFIGSEDVNKYISPRLFGNSKGDETQRPSRIIVRDADLIEDSFKGKELDLPYAEAKTEVVIDRITAQAMPRTIERVPAGAKFKMEMILNLFEHNGKKDDENEYKEAIKKAITLLHNDYLGGNGSRGYGQVDIKYKFEDVKI